MPRLSLLWFIIAGAVALIATETGAAPPVSCPLNRAVYQALDEDYELEFFRDFMTDRKMGESGVMHYRGAAGPASYHVYTRWGPGLALPYLFIPTKSSSAKIPPREGHESLILPFDTDFHPLRISKTAPPYLVLPGLPSDFYYWFEERKKYPDRRVPHVSWKLVRCRG